MVKIEEVKSSIKTQRISTHTHIKGLGLDDKGNAKDLSNGMCGKKRQEKQQDCQWN